jgi:hypothetical protein
MGWCSSEPYSMLIRPTVWSTTTQSKRGGGTDVEYVVRRQSAAAWVGTFLQLLVFRHILATGHGNLDEHHLLTPLRVLGQK